MAFRNDQTALRWLLGHELRRARLNSQRTQSEAAKLLGCTPAKINYLEIGRNQQHPDEVAELMRLYGADASDVSRLVLLAGRAAQGVRTAFSDAVPQWFRIFVGLEGLACSTFIYDTMVLSGQLQTKEYAIAMLEDNSRVSRAEAGQVVRARLTRQRLVDDIDLLRLHAVLEEAVLHRIVGGPVVMRGQLERLLELGERDNVTLQVLPTAVAVHDGLSGQFVTLDFVEAHSVSYVEYRDGAVYIHGQDQVEVYQLAAEQLVSRALSDADTAELLRARIADLS